jgi:hypothetical protein
MTCPNNRGRPSARVIQPQWQHLGAGQLIPRIPGGTTQEGTAFSVHSFRAPEWLVWSKPDGTWARAAGAEEGP